MISDRGNYENEGYFAFPFKPYGIQQDFMQKLYFAMENDKVGIFESPTGTGKSLSLICGALTWLHDHDAKQQEEMARIISGNALPKTEIEEQSSEPDWVEEFFQQKAAKDLIKKVKEREANRAKQKEKLDGVRQERRRKKRKRDSDEDTTGDYKNIDNTKKHEEDAELILDDYSSDAEKDSNKAESASEEEKEEEDEDENRVKIFYCSRTHSQLTQFVHEIQKSPFAEKIKVAVLASRQNYCINEEVKKLNSLHRINEKCLDMQKKQKEKKIDKKNEEDEKRKKRRKKEKTSGCPYYGFKKFNDFKDHVLMDVQDIEQLVSLGTDLDTCPYYGSRYSIKEAQLVVLPYQTLLHKSTRESVGINLKGSIVIIDEGHNLIETINSIHSIEVSASQISGSISQLSQYRDRYRTRLKAKNLMYIEQILFVLQRLLSTFDGNSEDVLREKSSNQSESRLQNINSYLLQSKIDNVNLFKIKRYCEKSQISKKLNGFVDKYNASMNNTENQETTRSSSFVSIEAFMEALTNADKDGRILITKTKLLSKSSLKFLMLNPAVHFMDVLQECKSVVVAGGTMQPVSEFKNVLLYSANVPKERVVEFSCGHVIPPENLMAVTMSKGPTSVLMDFTYQNRNKPELIDELGRLLCNVCTVVPGGVVCFFVSYDYEDTVYTRWFSTGILQKLESRKKVFREPKNSAHCDKVLSNYSNAIKKPKAGEKSGALLLSVVGGKMSEGINFSDELGRCIVMVGLPYPNIQSPELKEKMEFLNRNIGPTAGQEHYENICMKAVNQSIGRAIRHKGDFASILLVDHRFTRESVRMKLPTWINRQLQCHDRFGPGFGTISKFFAARRLKQ